MRASILALAVVVATGCGTSSNDESRPTTDKTPKVETKHPTPPDDDDPTAPRDEAPDHPMKKLAMTLPEGWSSSYYQSKRAHTVMATLPGNNAVEMLVMLLPAEYSPRLEDYLAVIVGDQTIDQYASITDKKALPDGFVVRGKRPHAAYELSLSRARRVGGAWLYCDGSFPDEASRDAALAVCDSAEFPGHKARLPAEDRQLFVPRTGTSAERIRWLWSETKPMMFEDTRASLTSTALAERKARIVGAWNELREALGADAAPAAAFTQILEAIDAIYAGTQHDMVKRMKGVEALLTTL